ncbi:MAG: nucleoside-diphosphate-sugar pyrophosphorylase [Candidatus Omnitrophica bacterium CG11_big_fil_rev_8_21_14_0_20_43_6]|nr:MAG: nucleoside-diphosphate-sugar pyrophosphorylase [Candidatus Omnitrophica bacterium CG11_big_fil_rev_8_21_14_0_20_43_6]
MLNQVSDSDIFILCGGFGKRLKAISGNIPKPMIKIAKKPFLDILIAYLGSLGFKRIILGIGYQAEFIRNYYAQQVDYRKILFSQEKEPLGTGGALKNAAKLITSNPFFVLNGDSFCRFNPSAFLGFHIKNKAKASILLREVPNGSDFGQIVTDKNGRILEFKEKNTGAGKCIANAGIYIFDQRIFSLLPRKKRFSLEYDFFPKLSGKELYGYPGASSFIDIGTPERYLKAKLYFKRMKNG